MKKIICLIIFIALTSCQSEDTLLSANFSGASKIEILDAEGNNRLNPNYTDPILLKNLNLYHLIDGERVLYFDGDMDIPKGLNIQFDTYFKKWVLSVAQNPFDQNKDLISTSILDFGDGTEGIIEGQWNKAFNPPTGGSLDVVNVWYNGEIVYEGNGQRIFSIVK